MKTRSASDRFGEPVERRPVVVVACDVADPGAEHPDDIRVNILDNVTDGLFDMLCEVLFGPIVESNADDPLVEAVSLFESVQGRNEQLAGQVAAGAKQDDRVNFGHRLLLLWRSCSRFLPSRIVAES